MEPLPNLWLFFLVVLGTVLLPGLDMAYVMSRSLIGGARGGALALSGIMCGALVHVVIGVLGVAAVVLVAPGAFNALLLAGAAYICWIGISLVRGASSAVGLNIPQQAQVVHQSGWKVFAMGMATNLLNPKAYLFMLAIFPQFFDPRSANAWAHAGYMWLIAIACQLLVYGGLAALVVRARGALVGSPVLAQWLFRAVGILLIGVALLTVWRGLD